MPKTINIPVQLVRDKTHWPKVVVLEEYEKRDCKGNLLIGIYLFSYQGKCYRIRYEYSRNKCIKSTLFYV